MCVKGGIRTQQGLHQHPRRQASVEEFPEVLEVLGRVSEEAHRQCIQIASTARARSAQLTNRSITRHLCAAIGSL